MKQKLKRNLTIMLILTLILSTFPCTKKASAATPRLNVKNITMEVGQTKTIKLINSKKKAKWSIEDEKIVIISETKKKVKFKAIDYGSTAIYAKVGKKEYKCRITIEVGDQPIPAITINPAPKPTVVPTTAPVVKPTIVPTLEPTQTVAPVIQPSPTPEPSVEPVATLTPTDIGSRENPLSAYSAYTTDVYDYATYLGKFTIQLLDYKDGQEAYNYVDKDGKKPIKDSQEYIYVKFKIDYISGIKEVKATDVINYFSDFYNSSANYQLKNEAWAHNFEDVTDISDVSLYPGGSAICSKGIVIQSGNTPITYRIQTGHDAKNYEHIYTWFTTAGNEYIPNITPIVTPEPTVMPVATSQPTVAPTATSKPAVILKQDGVEVLAEYTLSDDTDARHFMVIRNTSNKTVDITTNSLAYSKSGKIISAADASFDALGAGCTSVFYELFETSTQIDHYVMDMTVTPSEYYESVIQDLSYTQHNIDGGAIFQVTNNGKKAAEYVKGYALFFSGNTLVGYDYTYFTDDDEELKARATISKQITEYNNFDRIEFYLAGRRYIG